eukprot:5255507-Prymnesium_polylepis.1
MTHRPRPACSAAPQAAHLRRRSALRHRRTSPEAPGMLPLRSVRLLSAHRPRARATRAERVEPRGDEHEV